MSTPGIDIPTYWPNPNTNAGRSASVPWDSGITVTTSVPVKPLCAHDYDFLRTYRVYADPNCTTGPDCREIGWADLYYCRRCLEYREVKR